MNPQIVLETITNPTPLPLGKMAILEKIKSPLLTGETSTAYDLIPSVYIYTHPQKLNPGDLADTYQKIGLQIGGQNVNIQTVNQDILTTIKSILETIQRPQKPNPAMMI